MDPLKKHGINGKKMMDVLRPPVIKEEVDPNAGHEPELIFAKELPILSEREVLNWAAGPEIKRSKPKKKEAPPAAKNLQPPKIDDFELDIEIIEDEDLGYDAADVAVSDQPAPTTLAEDIVSWAVDVSLEKQRRHEAFLKEQAAAASDPTTAVSAAAAGGKATWWYDPASDPTPAVSIPGAATITSITAGDEQLQVNFTDPDSDGGSAITDYQYSLDGGTTWIDAGTTTSPITITGLTNGVEYNVVIRPVNAVGSGPTSNSSSATPSTVPDSVTIDSIVTGDQQVSVNFTAGGDGGSPITNYEYSTDGGTTFVALDPVDTTSPITITGLANGTEYDIVVRPVNANGSGTSSNTVTATPSTTPSAPTITSIVTADGQLTVSFNAPGDDGGSSITDYQVSTDGGSTFASIGGTTSPFVIGSLDTTNSFDVVIQAINANGAGTSSATVSSQAYAVSPTANNVDEGSSLTFNVTTANVANGTTLYWTINNITTADGDFSATSGTVSINSDAGTFSVTTVADSTTEGSQTFTVSLRTDSVSGTVVDTSATVTINDTSTNPWSPSTDITTVAWIDASDTGNYTTSGATLTAVTDKAGTYTMDVGGTPTVISSGLNGLNVFDFSGSSEYLQSNSYESQVSSGNHWAIGLFLADTVDGTKDSFWSYETNQSPKRDYAVSSGASNNTWPGELDLDALSSGRISSTIGNRQVWDSGISMDNWHIVVAIFNKTGNQISQRVDGANAFTPVNDYDNSLSTNQELRLMRNRASQELDGRLAEFFTVADLPGTGGTDITDVEKAEGYLAHKWGVTSLLPADHPYKSSPP